MIVDGVVYMRVLIIITPVKVNVICQLYALLPTSSSSSPTIASGTSGNRHSQIVYVLLG